jgi:hypothetical protein
VACGTVCGHHANQSPSHRRENVVVSQTVALSCPHNQTGLPLSITRGLCKSSCCPREAFWARPRKANSNRCREKHTASIAITHRASGRSARRNKALLLSSTLPSLSDGDLLANVIFCHPQKHGSLAWNDKTHQILYSTRSVGPMFAKQLTFHTTYTYTCSCKLTLRPYDAPVRSLSFDPQSVQPSDSKMSDCPDEQTKC